MSVDSLPAAVFKRGCASQARALAHGRSSVSVPILRQGFPAEKQSEGASSDAHGRASVCVLHVPSSVFAKEQADDSSPVAHGGEALCVPLV